MADLQIKELTSQSAPTEASLLEVQQPDESTTKKVSRSVLFADEVSEREAADTAIKAGAGLESDGSLAISGSNYIDSASDLVGALETLDTRIKSNYDTIALGNTSLVEIDLDSQDLTQMYTYPITLLEFGTQASGQTSVYMLVSAMIILYQTGNALSYGEDWYIGYKTVSDPPVQVANAIFQIPQSFIEDSSGNNVICCAEFLLGAGPKIGIVDAEIAINAPSADHGGSTVTSEMKVLLSYNSVEVTPETITP